MTPGIYDINDCKLYFNSYEKLTDWTKERNKYNLENLELDKNKIRGEIKNDEKGILALNVPFNPGWKCYVDGKKQEVVKVNGVFSGIELESGTHDIEMVFFPVYLKYGAIITVISICFSVIYFKIKRTKNRV